MKFIEAYETLRINIVEVILYTHQLVDFGFVMKRYRNLQKIYHPDRGGPFEESIKINLAFEKIKTLMSQGNENMQWILSAIF